MRRKRRSRKCASGFAEVHFSLQLAFQEFSIAFIALNSI